MAKIGVPKKDGSGGGRRANAGRGGHVPRKTGQGQSSSPPGRRRNNN